MRKLIAGFKVSVDGKIEGPQGYADWVGAWSEDYGLTGQIDACIVGGAACTPDMRSIGAQYRRPVISHFR